MKKLILVTLFLLCQYSFAQVEIVGSSEYGRIQFLSYDLNIQNKMYASTGGKHIVVSNDNGQNWKILYSISDNFAQIINLKIHSGTELSFSYSGRLGGTWNNKIFIINTATGLISREYDVPITPVTTGGYIKDWDFFNDDILMAYNYYGTAQLDRQAKVYYTKDGGTNWDMIYYNYDHETIFPQRVAISPNNPEKLFIGRSGGFYEHTGGLYISENAGQDWIEKYPNIDFGSIVFHPENADDILLGTWHASATQNLYRSLDGGNNWNVLDENWETNVLSNGILDIEYNPSNYNNIIITATNSIVRTYDNFQTKEVFNYTNDIENPNNYYFGFTASFNPFNTHEIIMTNNDFPLRSVDGGATLTKIKNPFFFAEFGQVNLFKSNGEKHLYYPVQNGYSHKNLNTLEDNPHGLLPVQVLPFTVNKFYSDQYQMGRVYGFYESTSFNGSGLSVSNDHGANVVGIPSPNTFMHAVTSKPSNQNIIICSLSDDYANSNLVQLDISDVNNIQQNNIPLPAQGLLRDFHFDTVNSNLMWIALNETMYKTLDNGFTWILQNNGLTLGSNDKIYQIDQNPLAPNQLTIATTKGIFTSINNGDNWSQMTTEEVQSVRHSDFNNNHIVAVTFDTEFTQYVLRYSGDGGLTWYQVPAQDLLYLNSDNNGTVVDFIGNTADVYIGTLDIGVIRYTIDFSKLSTTSPESAKDWITIAPNPSSDYIFLSLKNEVLEKAVFYSSTGQKVLEQNQQTRIDISHLSAGIYFIDITTKSGKTAIKKLIKK